MGLEQYRNITNRFQDVRLVSLRTWKDAALIEPRDPGGPYMVGQEGFDPADFTCTPDEYVLGRSGQWLSTSYFFRLPSEQRRDEFVFGTAAEVIALLESLPSNPQILHPGTPGPEPDAEPDELRQTFEAARRAGGQPPAGATPG